MAPAGLWIDTDIALGAAKGDVDDGWAMAALLRGAAPRILGISSVFGNTDERTAHRCAAALLAVTGRTDLRLVRGASRAGEMTEAAEAISVLPEGTHVLALGPLTNVAAALARDPSVASRITVSIVGGNPSSLGRWPPLWPFEFNLAKDPRASHDVFASRAKRRVFTLDVACELTVDPRDLVRIARASELGRHLARTSVRWLAYSPFRYRSLRFPLWDAVPALDALGLLGGVEHTRRWRIAGAGLLVQDEKAQESTWISGFDVQCARTSLERVIAR